MLEKAHLFGHKSLWPSAEAIMCCKGGTGHCSSENVVFACFDKEDDEATSWEGCHSHPCDLGC